MSVYEHEQLARKQGFFYAVVLVMPTYEQFGYVMWSEHSAALAEGRRSVSRGSAHGYEVRRVSLVEPFTSEVV